MCLHFNPSPTSGKSLLLIVIVIFDFVNYFSDPWAIVCHRLLTRYRHHCRSSHTGDPIDTEKPTDVIYVYEGDGLRIAYFAGLDQEQLTDDLKAMTEMQSIFLKVVPPRIGIDLFVTQKYRRFSRRKFIGLSQHPGLAR